MSLDSAPRVAEIEPLTDAQRELVAGHVGLIGAAVRRVLPLCKGVLTARDLEGLGHEGLVVAARRYERSYDVPFEFYARFRIEGEMMDGLRREGRHARIAFAARAASRRMLALQVDPSNVMKDTPEDTGRQLAEVAHGMLGAMLATAVAEADSVAGEEGIILRETHANAIRALARAREELSPRDRKVLDLLYRDEKDLKEIAGELGVSYATVRRQHDGIRRRLAAQLQTMGVKGAPAK